MRARLRLPHVRLIAGTGAALSDHQIRLQRRGLLEGRREAQNPIVGSVGHIQVAGGVDGHRSRRGESRVERGSRDRPLRKGGIKICLPITRFASPQLAGAVVPQTDSPSGLRQASTRLLLVSATYRIGGVTLVSNAIAEGLFSSLPSTRFGTVDVSVVTRACCPNSREGENVHRQLTVSKRREENQGVKKPV